MTFVARGVRWAGVAILSLPFLGAWNGLFAAPGGARSAADLMARVSQHEASGDLAGAQTLLNREAGDAADPAAAQVLAEFLGRHRIADSREAYLRWASAETDPDKKRLALRQMILNDLAGQHSTLLAADLERYRSAGGTDLSAPVIRRKNDAYSEVYIPGPLSPLRVWRPFRLT